MKKDELRMIKGKETNIRREEHRRREWRREFT